MTLKTLAYCPSCRKAYQIIAESVEDNAIGLLGENQSFSCITDLCRGRLAIVDKKEHERVFVVADVIIPIDSKEFYRAAMGGNRSAITLQQVEDLLVGGSIVSIKGYETGMPTRVIIEEVVLENGARLHFSSSTKGACLFKIEEPEHDPA